MKQISKIILIVIIFLAGCQTSDFSDEFISDLREAPGTLEPLPQINTADPDIGSSPVTITQTASEPRTEKTITSSSSSPEQEKPFDLPRGTKIIALLGSDSAFPYIQRTDTMLFLFLNSANDTAALLSFPSGIYISQPDQELKKLNELFKDGGPELFENSIKYNYGLSPDQWILIHFDSFVDFINDQGGVTLQVNNPLPDDCGGIPGGQVLMNGEKALCYVREIRTSGEFERNLRMLSLLKTVIQQTVCIENIPRLPGWYSKYRNSVQTDLGLVDLLRYFPLAINIKDLDQIQYFQISPGDLREIQLTQDGKKALVVDPEKFKILLEKITRALEG